MNEPRREKMEKVPRWTQDRLVRLKVHIVGKVSKVLGKAAVLVGLAYTNCMHWQASIIHNDG